VFNKNFIERNVFTLDDSVAPIVFLGEKNIEREKEYRAKQDDVKKLEGSINDIGKTAEKLSRSIDRIYINAAKQIKEMLRSGDQNNSYNNYDKRRAQRTFVNLEKFSSEQRSNFLLTDDYKDILRKRLRGDPMPLLELKRWPNNSASAAYEAVADLLKTELVSEKVLSFFSPDTEAWAASGFDLHERESLELCEFCGQQIPSKRLSDLRMHFNDEFQLMQERANELVQEIDRLLNHRAEDFLVSEGAVYFELRDDLKRIQLPVKFYVEAWFEILRSAREMLLVKLSNPFGPATELNVETPVCPTEFKDIEKLVQIHNEKSENFTSQQNEARRLMEWAAVCEEFDAYSASKNELLRIKDTLQASIDEKRRLENLVDELEAQILDHRRPADELNADLRSYLGHSEISFEVEGGGYRIRRGEKPAGHLSEGERSAIAFLYFLTSLRSKDFDLKNGVVVIDDPISSLDSSALFHAFGYMREHTNDAKQLIVLTHNYMFFRQTKNWFRHLPKQNKKDQAQRPANFFMLKAQNTADGRISGIYSLDPFLWEYDSEYHYLFKQVWLAAGSSADESIETLYAQPNVARRLLEGFLAFRSPELAGKDLRQQLDEVAIEQAKKSRILRFLHTHSHNAAMDQEEADFSGLQEAKQVFRDLLDLIQQEDVRHYEKMKALVERKTTLEEEAG
jgi:wobble nucleotide-excising tRNase